MWSLVVLLTCLGAISGRLPLIRRITVTREADEGTISRAIQATSSPRCGFVFFFDHGSSDSLVAKASENGWKHWSVAAFFNINALKREFNETQSLSHLVFLARQVRRLSRCTVVVVVSHDPAFLAAFAEWSLRGRLLAWSTRLVVVTRLALPQLRALLPAHWTFAMMNAIVLNVEDASSSFQVFSYLPYSPSGPQVAQVASWTPSRGFVLTEGCTLFKEKFLNFYGARVNVTALPYAPFWEERAGPNNITVYSGTDYNTLASIAQALNFTVSVVPTSSWSEVTRLVEQRVAFMAPVVFNVMPHRLERYDFSFVYEYVSMDFSMAPPGLRPQWKALYYPLSGHVWLAILLSLLLVPCVLLFVSGVLSDKRSGSGGSERDYGAVVQGVAGMLLGQSLALRLSGTSSTRILVAVWLVVSIIFVSAYQGNLTASLTLPKYPSRPETLPQLVNAVKRLTMQQYGTDFKTFFSKSKSQLFQSLVSLIDIVPSLTMGQQQAVEHNQAHLDNRRYQQYNIAKRFTRADGGELLYIGRESIMPGQSAWPLPHDAPYTALIDRRLMAVIEAGLYEKWASDILFQVKVENRYLRLQQQEEEGARARSRESSSSLSLIQMQGAFMLLTLGLALAGLVFAGELAARKLLPSEQLFIN